MSHLKRNNACVNPDGSGDSTIVVGEDSSTRGPKESKKDTEGRFWCFTVYQNEEGEYVNFPASVHTLIITQKAQKAIKYLIYQEEKCPKTQRLHLQGFMITKDKIKHSALRNAFPGHHFEMRYKDSTNQQAKEYCRKDDSATGKHKYEAGEFEEAEQGKRNDLQAVMDAIQDDATLRDIAGRFGPSMIRYDRGIRSVHSILTSAPNRGQPFVCIFWGPTGTGKTEFAGMVADLLECGEPYMPAQNNAGRFSFESYVDSQAILLEDFNGAEMLGIQPLLKICDRGRFTLPGRGISPHARHQYVFITSNKSPDEWGYSAEHVAALRRRCDLEMYCDYDEWTVETARNNQVPNWIAQSGSLNSSNSKFPNVFTYLRPELAQVVEANKRLKRHSATSRNFILPAARPIADEEKEPEAVDIYEDFDLSPAHISTTLPFIYDLTQDD